MADPLVSDTIVAAVQASNQYAIGLVGGYLIDQVMDLVPISSDNVSGRAIRQGLQVLLNGVALNYILKTLHGGDIRGYRDPSGGYLLAIGLIQGQQTFMKNGKDLIGGLTLFWKEIWNLPTKETETFSAKTD